MVDKSRICKSVVVCWHARRKRWMSTCKQSYRTLAAGLDGIAAIEKQFRSALLTRRRTSSRIHFVSGRNILASLFLTSADMPMNSVMSLCACCAVTGSISSRPFSDSARNSWSSKVLVKAASKAAAWSSDEPVPCRAFWL